MIRPEHWVVWAGHRQVVGAEISSGRLRQVFALPLPTPSHGDADWATSVGTVMAGLSTLPQRKAAIDWIVTGCSGVVRLIRLPAAMDAPSAQSALSHEVAEALPLPRETYAVATALLAEDPIERTYLMAATEAAGPETLLSLFEDSPWMPTRFLSSAGVLAGLARSHPGQMFIEVGNDSVIMMGWDENGDVRARSVKMGEGNDEDTQIRQIASEVDRTRAAFRHHGFAAKGVWLTGEWGEASTMLERLAASIPAAHVPAVERSRLGPGVEELMLAVPSAPVVDWMPDHFRCARRRRAQAIGLLVGATLALLGGIGFAGGAWTQANAWQEHHAAITQQVERLDEVHREMQGVLGDLEAVDLHISQIDGLLPQRHNWNALLGDFQARLVSVEDVWLDHLQVVYRERTLGPSEGDRELRPALHLRGRMLDRANPLARISPQMQQRVDRLIASFAESAFILSVGETRFDNSQPGLLGFEFILTVNPERPL